MEEIIKAVLAALSPITASVEKIDEAGSECYGVETPDGERLFITFEPA